ncbi:MAG: hypothetical protein IJH47_00305 [Oscillospiraceae bacterium]|nr:hypothetical protein [Oscillospiraceae bacterium]
MWKNDRWKTVVLNIFLALLIVAIVAGLGYFMLRVRQQTREHDEQLSELYVQQQQQQTEARQESVTAIQDEYQKDMDTVARYLPGIVCWGDSLTLGSSGNISYPAVLKTYLETYFCDIYDFRSTIENAEDYARLRWDDYTVSVPVVNMGAGPENTYTVLGRCGAVPYVLGKDIVIPAECEGVEVTLKSQEGNDVSPLTGGNAGVNNVHIGDIEGTLAIVSNANEYFGYKYFFTRSEPGEETPAAAGTVIQTAAENQYKDYIHVVCIGTYGKFTNADDLVEQIRQLLARQTNNPERYIVLGLCSIEGQSASGSYLDVIDTAMMQAFGNRYINVRKYLIEDGLADAKINPTAQDKVNISMHRVPVSFTTSSGSNELNGKAYALIGKLVYSRMESLGYFDEVYDELGIRETTKRILKEDPGYFERIIQNSLK